MQNKVLQGRAQNRTSFIFPNFVHTVNIILLLNRYSKGFAEGYVHGKMSDAPRKQPAAESISSAAGFLTGLTWVTMGEGL